MAEVLKPSNTKYVCPTCGELFALKASLKKHCLKHNEKKEPNVNVNGTSIYEKGWDSSLPSVCSRREEAVLLPLDISSKSDLDIVPEIEFTNSDFDARSPRIAHSNITDVPADSGICMDVDTSDYASDRTILAPPPSVETPYNCQICNKAFDAEPKLLQHNNSLGHRSKLSMHKNSLGHEKINASEMKEPEQHLPSQNVTLFVCDVVGCSRSFDSKVKLYQHQEMKHEKHLTAGLDSEKKTENKEFPCYTDDCDKVFQSNSQLLQHLIDKHEEKNNLTTSPYRLLCPHCDEFNQAASTKPFVFLTYIAKHLILDHPKPGYIKGTCPICSMRLEKQKNVLNHVARSHLFNQFKEEACFICLRLCKDKNDLLQHTTTVHRYRCIMDSCYSMFPSQQHRDKHMLDKHQVYACGIDNCNQIFSSLEDKIQHSKTMHQTNDGKVTHSLMAGVANNHERGIYSEPTLSKTYFDAQSQSGQLNQYSRNSADEFSIRTSTASASAIAVHRRFRESVNDLEAFIHNNSSHLNQLTDRENSDETFNVCENLKSLLDGVQRRLTPRVD